MRWTVLLLSAALSAPATASTGPWILGPGDEQIYVGLDAQRFTRLALSSGTFADDVVQVDEGVNTFGAKLIATFGVTKRVELEFELPFAYSYVNRQGPVCDSLGLDACEPSVGVGIVVARGKVVALDEVAGAPLTLSFGLDLRFGQPTAAFRPRITAFGTGTFDVEPRLALGRIGSIRGGRGYFSVFADASFRYRVPASAGIGPTPAPLPSFEVTANFENLWTPVELVSFGPAVSLLSRPIGYDVEQVLGAPELATHPGRFEAINLLALDAGGKLLFRNGKNVTVALAAFYTLYAENNPTDVVKVSAGVAFRDFIRRRED